MDLRTLKQEWLEALDSAERFVSSRPPKEAGCLYDSASRRTFVDPRETSNSVPHYGRPGGLLPRVTNF